MTKTTLEVVTSALRRAGIAAVDEPADAGTFAEAKALYEGLYAELPGEGFATLTDANAVPEKAFNAIVQMTADEIGPTFGVQRAQNSWREGLKRLRRQYMPDDRSDPADLNNDGTISAEETQDDLEAQFY